MTMLVALPPRLRLRARVPIAPIGRMTWTRNGDRLIVGGTEATSILESAAGGEVERWPHAYTAFACGWDDTWVAAANARGYVDLWRFGQPRPGEPTARHNGRIGAIAYSDDNRRVFTAGDDGRVGIWRAATLDAAFYAVGGRAHDLAYDGERDRLAVAAGRSGVVLLDGSNGERRGGVRPPDRATAVAWTPDFLLVGTRDGQLATYDATRLEPARATVALGVGAIARVLRLGGGVVVEGSEAIGFVDATTGELGWKWPHGMAVSGGSMAVHVGQSAIAVAVPAALSILDVEPEPPRAATAKDAPVVAAARRELLVLQHPSDVGLARPLIEHLEQAGASVIALSDDSRRFVDVARRISTAVILYGPSGAPLRHDYLVDVLETRGVHVVPVILPGGAVPEAQRRFHGAAYVCFHARVNDDDALTRVTRAVFGRV